MSEIQVHVPVDIRDVPPMKLAARPAGLKGLRVGLLDNGKEYSNIVMDGLGRELAEAYGAGEIDVWRKGFPAKGAPFIAEMARAVDVAVSGVGH